MEQISIIPLPNRKYQIDLHIAGYHFSIETVSLDFAVQARDDIMKKLELIKKCEILTQESQS